MDKALARMSAYASEMLENVGERTPIRGGHRGRTANPTHGKAQGLLPDF